PLSSLPSHLHPPYLPSFPTRRSSDLYSPAAFRTFSCRRDDTKNRARLRNASNSGLTSWMSPFFLACSSTPSTPVTRSPALSAALDRKSTRLNSSHDQISYAVFCLKKK